MSRRGDGAGLGIRPLAPRAGWGGNKFGAASVIACACLICATAAASLAAAPGGAGLFGAALAVLMIAIAAADADRFVIPDRLSGGAVLLGLTEAARRDLDDMVGSLGMAALRGLVLALVFLALREIYRRLRQRQGIGLGDVKLAAVAGVWLDWTLIPVAIECAALTALAVYGSRQFVLRHPLRASARLPFGLFLAPAIWLCWLLEAIFFPIL